MRREGHRFDQRWLLVKASFKWATLIHARGAKGNAGNKRGGFVDARDSEIGGPARGIKSHDQQASPESEAAVYPSCDSSPLLSDFGTTQTLHEGRTAISNTMVDIAKANIGDAVRIGTQSEFESANGLSELR
ncbi:hypothetical protein L596_011958 [Steinernema carpocapsae]|uniref:Uncharacterized protein n=1 Tax=Steinernema carpocapsae TaxID=34508 RepID=A0A4U5NWG1_STECR|nr:hypothetical protein L596_011958 [Steinernema carpocapsae]